MGGLAAVTSLRETEVNAFFFLPQSGCRENIRPSGKGPLCDTQGGLSQVGRWVERLLAAAPTDVYRGGHAHLSGLSMGSEIFRLSPQYGPLIIPWLLGVLGPPLPLPVV